MEALRCVGLLAAFGGLTVGCSEDGKLDAGVPLAHDLAVVDAESIGPGDEGAPCVRDFGWLANEPVDLSVAGCSDTCYQPDAFPQFARNCTSDCDCLVATYWSDCCGTQRSVGYSSSVAAEARRTLLAYNYVCCRPICTCARPGQVDSRNRLQKTN